MKHHIDIQNALETPSKSVLNYLPSNEQLESWVNEVLSERNTVSEITLRLVEVTEIQSLNRIYRHKDKPTNVLSFPAEIPDEFALNLLGDVVICSSVVEKEAKDQQKLIEAHWAHMVVHGALHLLGYDHLNTSDAKQMESKEIEILCKFGYPNPYLIEEA